MGVSPLLSVLLRLWDRFLISPTLMKVSLLLPISEGLSAITVTVCLWPGCSTFYNSCFCNTGLAGVPVPKLKSSKPLDCLGGSGCLIVEEVHEVSVAILLGLWHGREALVAPSVSTEEITPVSLAIHVHRLVRIQCKVGLEGVLVKLEVLLSFFSHFQISCTTLKLWGF